MSIAKQLLEERLELLTVQAEMFENKRKSLAMTIEEKQRELEETETTLALMNDDIQQITEEIESLTR